MGSCHAIDQCLFDEQAARTTLEKIIVDASLGRTWLIILEDVAIGYLVITFGYSLEYHGRDAFIHELFIVASYRNQGIGTKAIQFAFEACPKLGIRALHLEVERTNLAAQALYRKFRFESHDRLLMARRISSNLQ